MQDTFAEYREITVTDPLRQGDVLEATDDNVSMWQRTLVVLTADCDLAFDKHQGRVTCVPLIRDDDYLQAMHVPRLREKIVKKPLAELRTLLRSAGAPSISDQRLREWPSEENPSDILLRLDLDETRASVALAALQAIRMIDATAPTLRESVEMLVEAQMSAATPPKRDNAVRNVIGPLREAYGRPPGDDPLYRIRGLLRRGREHLTDRQVAKLNTGLQAGDPGFEVTVAWHAYQQLRSMYQAPTAAEGRRIAEQVIASFPDCPIPEVARLGRTLRAWKARTSWPGSTPTASPTAGPRRSTCSSRRPAASPTASAPSTTTAYGSCSTPPAPAPTDEDRPMHRSEEPLEPVLAVRLELECLPDPPDRGLRQPTALRHLRPRLVRGVPRRGLDSNVAITTSST